MDFEGKAALVTGASAGLGAELARELGRRGVRLVLVARGAAALEQVAKEIREAGGVAHPVPADVGEKDAVLAITGAAAALVGPIDFVIHDASTLGSLPMPLLLDTECEDLGRVLEVNLVGPFRITKAVLGSMVLRGGGTIATPSRYSVARDAA